MVFSWLYIFVNFMMKMAFGLALVSNAKDRLFPVLGCKAWDGRYEALEEAGMH
jgi:hypothetical protein